MQIHEITKQNTVELNEGVGSALGTAAGSVVSGLGKAVGAVASPFKDVAQSYKTARADSTVRLLADKLMRGWQQYMVQWAKSQGGTYTVPGSGTAPRANQTPTGQTPTGQTPPGQTKTAPGQQKVDMEKLFNTVQALDDKQLKGIASILSQRVGPQATMNALKKPEPTAPVTESQLDELSWKDIQRGATAVKTGAQNFTKGLARTGDKIAGAATAVGGAAKELGYQAIGRPATAAYQAVKPGLAAAGQLAKQGIQQAPALAKAVGKEYSKAATKVGQAVKAAPGAVATAAGATAGAVAGMPARAQTAYRTGKQFASGPQMTTGELNMVVSRLTTKQAEKLLAFVNQIQTSRKAGLREGVSDNIAVDKYRDILKAFVQKNLFSGMQYSQIQNVGDIDQLVNDIVDPANDTMAKQKDLWNKLTLAASVAQRRPAPGGTSDNQSAPTTDPNTKPTSTEDPELLVPTIKQALSQAAPQGTLNAIGSVVRQGFTQNNATIRSTGEPGVDALLMAMKFNVQ
jgi:hypothetical protein